MSPRHKALKRRLREIRRELSALNQDVRALERGKPRVSVPRAEPRRAQAAGVAAGPEARPGQVRLERPEVREPELPDDMGVSSADRPEDVSQREEQERAVKARGEYLRDDRFADYLASSFHAVRPLRHERRLQRNKAILLTVVVLAIVVWAVLRWWR